MEQSLGARLRHAWNAFRNRDPTKGFYDHGMSYSYRSDRIRLTRGHERTIVNAIYNRIAIDVASIEIKHVQLDENKRYESEIESGLNNCLTLDANIDQTGRALVQDIVMSMFSEGVIAIVPVDQDKHKDGSFDVLSLRTGKIVDWYPSDVKIEVYNERTARREQIIMSKREVCIIENPLYSIINEPNSTMQRLVRKLSLLDITDERTSSGKLDLIIQLPFTTKSELRQQQADARKKKIEDQLVNSPHGIAYLDGTEKITQLNRPVENNLMAQIEYLTSMLQSQLGITQSILDGTADEQTMLNYHTRTIEPIVAAIVDEMKRKFLTFDSRSKGESILYFRDPFKLVPVNSIADIADKFTRNEIMSSNEFRQIVGRKPSDDPKADQLVNSNLNQPEPEPGEEDAAIAEQDAEIEEILKEGENQNG